MFYKFSQQNYPLYCLRLFAALLVTESQSQTLDFALFDPFDA